MTRQGVIQAILAGRLAGYALAGPKNLRWFVYRDALAQEPSREKQLEEEAAGIRKRLAAAENTITALRAAQEQRRESLRLYQQSLQKVLSAHADLAEAYQRLATVADAADDELLGNWIQAYPPEES
jgi:predicted  nucleic acid-binding Zn-ribbon protein